jgi:hypothetical protein
LNLKIWAAMLVNKFKKLIITSTMLVDKIVVGCGFKWKVHDSVC